MTNTDLSVCFKFLLNKSQCVFMTSDIQALRDNILHESELYPTMTFVYDGIKYRLKEEQNFDGFTNMSRTVSDPDSMVGKPNQYSFVLNFYIEKV
ncbi:hypothetical protein ACEN9X_05145 [Mucilaginibacter sp. Mucisp86]|uniref:hypothetical protein n=1 Tax=Mucilaginibacter sp. Mucisp86 TaxID=3243060 RepID=UPI0039B5976F